MGDVLRGLLVIAPATIIVVEVFRLCPVVRLAHGLLEQMRKSAHVVAAGSISEHWKERVLPAYAAAMLRTSLLLGGWLLALLAIFAAALQVTGSVLQGGFDALAALERVDYALSAMAVTVVYLVLKRASGHA
jgi:hypothetical protein